MPLVKDPVIIPTTPEESITPITPTPGQRPDGEFKNSVVDVRKRSVDTLLAHVEGSYWKTDYYRQLLTDDMQPSSFQTKQLTPYQQYEKISDYPIRVTDPLSSSQTEDTLLFEVNGSGILSFAIVPNIGDVFYADIGDGRYGLFSIEKIIRKTILKDSVYSVDYVLIEYKNDTNEQLLNDRTVRELHYSPDHLGSGRGPLIMGKELSEYRTIQKEINILFSYHSRKFMDRENTVLVRPEEKKTYDPYFSLFWNDILPKSDMSLSDIPRVLIVGDEYRDYKTIWDSLKNKDPDFKFINHGVNKESSEKQFVNLIYNGVSLTNIEKVISVDVNYGSTDNGSYTFNEDTVPDIKSVPVVGSYVFTESFYLKEYEKMSKLEYMTIRYLEGEYLDVKEYLDLLFKSTYWDGLEQFYFIPILIVLGSDYLRQSS